MQSIAPGIFAEPRNAPSLSPHQREARLLDHGIPRSQTPASQSPIQHVTANLVAPDGDINAHHLGTVEYQSRLASGGMIALLGSLSNMFPAMAVKELLGFAGFYGSIGIIPHIVHFWVKQKTGLDLDDKYISSQGDRRKLYSDPQYLPLHLLPNEEIDKIGEKLGVPRHLPNRRRVIEDRIRSTVAQSQAWWMLLVGPMVPITGSLVGRALENPALQALNKVTQAHYKSLFTRLKQHPRQQHWVKRAMETVVGESPNTELSRWWEKLQKDVVRQLDIPAALEALPAREQQHQSWWHRVMDNHLQRLSAAHVHGRSPKVQQRLSKLVSRLDKVYLPRITQMENKLADWRQLGNPKTATLLAQQHALKLESARNIVRQYKNLIKLLQNPSYMPSRETLHAALQGGNTTNVVRLMEQGDYAKATRYLGTGKDLLKAIGINHGRQGGRLNSMLGASIADQLTQGAKAILNQRHFMRWMVLGVGGVVGLISAVYYALVVGKPSRRNGNYFASSKQILEKYNQRGEFEALQEKLNQQKALKASLPPLPANFAQPLELKRMFRDNQAVVYALNLRTFGGVDLNHDGRVVPGEDQTGTFINAIGRLDELKQLGVNTIHLLPINPPGVLKRKGTGGSVYAVADYHTLNPQLADPNSSLNIYEQARTFIAEAHKRGIKVMVDVPSVAAYDLAITHPELISVDGYGHTLTPADWEDVVLFNNDEKLQNYYEGFFDLMTNTVGVDGFRVDVARSRPNWFWRHFIEKFPNHAWLAESYVEEDASPLQNIPRDVPEKLLGVGFDSIYGQNHIFHKMKSGQTYLDYLQELEGMMTRANQADGYAPVPQGKSVIGSFLTHDDKETLMDHGGITYNQFATALMAFQPFTNPYIVDGMQTGYSKRINIFDYAPAHVGSYPEMAPFMSQVFNVRKQYADVLAKGQFTPIMITGDAQNQLFAYTLSSQGKTLLVVGNKDMNARSTGSIHLALRPGTRLSNLIPDYGRQSYIHTQPTQIHANLGPGRLLVFEV